MLYNITHDKESKPLKSQASLYIFKSLAPSAGRMTAMYKFVNKSPKYDDLQMCLIVSHHITAYRLKCKHVNERQLRFEA